MTQNVPQSPSQPSQQASQMPWWFSHIIVGFFCLLAIVLGSLDHFVAADRWGVAVDLGLIGAGLTTGGVTLGHAWALPQTLTQTAK